MAEDGPADAGTIHQGLVHILHGAHAPHHQILHLSVQRQLQPIGDKARALLAQEHSLFPDGLIEIVYGLDHLIRALLSPGDLYQRDEVGGIIGVGAHTAFRVGGLSHDLGNQQSGGAAGV